MGIQALQKFIETNCPGACVPVDLLKIARSVAVRRSRGNKGGGGGSFTNARLCLVVDGECCLDRLYGGFFSDWVCGGQWNRMVQFLAVLIQTIQHNNIELAVFFNGSLESQRMGEWIKQQHNERKKINQVLKHVNTKGTPPPKVWWVPPVCLTTCLRMALRHLNIAVVCTMDDHHQEVIAYCRENYFHGLMAEDAEYAIFDPPRYFSSEQLKLTYKGSLETKEFILDEVAKGLDLHPNRFCVFAALLGNYLLTEEDLHEFYKTICPEAKTKQLIPSDVLIRAVCTYVRALPTIDNLDVIGSQVFGSNAGPNDERIQKFKQCVQYYLNGTKDGFLRYRPSNNARRYEPGHYPPSRPFPSRAGPTPAPVATTAAPANLPPAAAAGTTTSTSNATTSVPSQTAQDGQTNSTSPSDVPPTSDPSKFASETVESELSSLSAYQEATGMYAAQIPAPQIVIDPPTQSQILGTDSSNAVSKAANNKISPHSDENEEKAYEELPTSVSGAPVVSAGSYGAWVNGVSASSPSPVQPTGKAGGTLSTKTPNRQAQLPSVPPEVMRTASERHQKGLMSPWIYQILSQGEIKLALSIEEETPKDLPSAALLYRPIRQMVYAILFNMHHVHFLAKQKADQIKQTESSSTDSPSDISVKEWAWVKNNSYKSPEDVKAVPLGWAVPTVQRLWFGATVDDKKRRLRAFLTCMRSDSALMLNTSYVPQHLLVMCCVLRYIISFNDKRILRKQELDAFLAQAVSPQLMNAPCMQNMQLPLITSRGVQLAALFMRGVEAALFANDACGAPVPWLMCCPWLFFDGKLFHHKLLKANTAKNLIEICDGQIDQVAKVERMRQAILEGLKVEFARPPLPIMAGPPRVPGFAPPPPHMLPAGAHFPGGRGRARGLLAAGEPGRAVAGRRGMLARGGQLEIAGVVVGSWGPNFGAAGRGRSLQVAPQVTSVGGMRRYGAMPGGMSFPRGGYSAYGLRRVPARIKKMGPQITGPRKKPKKPSVRPTRTAVGEEENNEPVVALGRGCTLQAGDSKVVPVSQLVLGGAGDSVAEKVTLNGQFEDAREESAKTVIMKKGQGDPPVVVSNNTSANIKEVKKEVSSVAPVITQSGDAISVVSEAMRLASEVD